jgi:hypothetical protein
VRERHEELHPEQRETRQTPRGATLSQHFDEHHDKLADEQRAQGTSKRPLSPPRWGVNSQVKPPRSAFSFFASGVLERFLKDESFNRRFRLSQNDQGLSANDDSGEGSKAAWARREKLLTLKVA